MRSSIPEECAVLKHKLTTRRPDGTDEMFRCAPCARARAAALRCAALALPSGLA